MEEDLWTFWYLILNLLEISDLHDHLLLIKILSQTSHILTLETTFKFSSFRFWDLNWSLTQPTRDLLALPTLSLMHLSTCTSILCFFYKSQHWLSISISTDLLPNHLIDAQEPSRTRLSHNTTICSHFINRNSHYFLRERLLIYNIMNVFGVLMIQILTVLVGIWLFSL